jgi:hypothetical protein
MRLADLVQRTPGARLATMDDNTRILEFFDRAPMQTSGFALQYRRAPDFFRLLRYQGDRAHVVINVDDHGAVRGLGTLSLRTAWIGGAPATVGYLGDLRVGFDRTVIRHWRTLFADLITHARDIEELAECDAWLTTIMDDNRLARRVLASDRADAPTYVPLAPFTMRNVVARLPFTNGRGAGHWRSSWATPADADRLTAFYETENRGIPFGFRDELRRRLGTWDSLSVGDFIIVENGGSIVGCVAPWSAAAAKDMLVSRLPLGMRVLGGASALLPGGMVRVPRRGEPLRIAYLTHLTFSAALADADRLEVFRAIMDRVFAHWSATNWHCVAFADFEAWNLGRALRGYVQQTVPITLYTVHAPGRRVDHAARGHGGTPPAFEMATV